MPRRHLFDSGYAASDTALIAGSQVLLALSRQSLRRSRTRLGSSLLQIADTSQRVMLSLAQHLLSHGQTLDTRAQIDRSSRPMRIQLCGETTGSRDTHKSPAPRASANSAVQECSWCDWRLRDIR